MERLPTWAANAFACSLGIWDFWLVTRDATERGCKRGERFPMEAMRQVDRGAGMVLAIDVCDDRSVLPVIDGDAHRLHCSA